MNIRRKLSSRKFWLALATAVAGYVVAFGGSQEQATTITGLIMSTASVVAYVLAEGFADGNNKNDTDN